MKYYIKKYQEPYLPLNKNYPTEITDLFMLGKYKEFEDAKKAYDEYYGKILPEVEIAASKTIPTKISDWTSEYNVAEDSKKYEQVHQTESLKVASAVNHKMHEVGNSIGSTALEIGSSFTPLWMIAPATRIGLDISKGNYADAALTAGLSFAAPYALGKYVIPGVAKGVKYLDDVAIKTITPYRNYRIASEFGKGVLKTTLKAPLAVEIPENHLVTNYSNPVTTTLKASLRFLEKPSKLTEAERLGIPKGGKVPYTPEENIAFRNQINEFAKKYGYNTIGDEVTDPEVLEKYARALIKQHNTFYRGVRSAPDELTLIKWGSEPIPDAEMYISPYSHVARMYGDVVELLKPYKLGPDRTKWFIEGNFDIIPSAGKRISQGYSGKSGIYAPWVHSGRHGVNNSSPESELVVINKSLIPQRVLYRMPVYSSYIKSDGAYRFSPWWRVGNGSYTGSKNMPNKDLEFKQGGSIHIKEKNKGSFTKYCKGKVTEECIRKGKNSPNPKIRKKATFAANARKWKHLNGGIINYLNMFTNNKLK